MNYAQMYLKFTCFLNQRLMFFSEGFDLSAESNEFQSFKTVL